LGEDDPAKTKLAAKSAAAERHRGQFLPLTGKGKGDWRLRFVEVF